MKLRAFWLIQLKHTYLAYLKVPTKNLAAKGADLNERSESTLFAKA